MDKLPKQRLFQKKTRMLCMRVVSCYRRFQRSRVSCIARAQVNGAAGVSSRPCLSVTVVMLAPQQVQTWAVWVEPSFCSAVSSVFIWCLLRSVPAMTHWATWSLMPRALTSVGLGIVPPCRTVAGLSLTQLFGVVNMKTAPPRNGGAGVLLESDRDGQVVADLVCGLEALL